MPIYFTGGGGTPGGSDTQLQRNAAGLFGGISGATSDGTTLTATSPRIVTSILDANGNPLFALTATVSAVYGLTLANAALLGTVALSATAPTAAADSVAGTPISITSRAAVAGLSNAGAAAGGAVTITSGAAARLTSGNANGGNINLVTGAGIGTGTAGQVVIPAGANGAPSLAIGDAVTGWYSPGSGILSIGSTLRLSSTTINFGSLNPINWYTGGAFSAINVALCPATISTPRLEVNNGSAGTYRDLIARQLFAGGDNAAGLASTISLTNATDTTTTNAYVVGGGQAATTKNTGWTKIYVGTTVAWVPYWENATP